MTIVSTSISNSNQNEWRSIATSSNFSLTMYKLQVLAVNAGTPTFLARERLQQPFKSRQGNHQLVPLGDHLGGANLLGIIAIKP